MRKAKGVTQASPKGISEEGPRARPIQAPIAEEATTVAHGVQEVKEKSERCRATSSPGNTDTSEERQLLSMQDQLIDSHAGIFEREV